MKKSVLFVVCICLMSQLALAGNLNPTTPPTAGTMKPLDEVEPRTQINSVPYTISSSGSYYLTKNLISTGTGITIASDDVTLDLCGFTLTGPGSGATYGIYINLAQKNIEIRNGTIKNFGYDGIASDFGTGNCRIIGVQLVGNKRHGIYFSSSIHDIVKDCSVNDNGSSFAGNVYGIYIGINSTAAGNIVHSNGSWATGNVYGIIADDNCTVTGNTIHGIGMNAGGTVNGIKTKVSGSIIGNTVRSINGIGIVTTSTCQIRENRVTVNTGGISSGDHCTISGNMINLNASYGINAGFYCTISNCTVTGNLNRGIYANDYSTITNCTASQNDAEGIYAMSHCTVSGNNVGNNKKTGLFCWSGKVTGNTVTNNNQNNDSTLAGIMIWGESQVRDNMTLNNKACNIFIHASGSNIENNSVRGSANGIKFDAGGNYYAGNRASNNTTAYANPAGNTDGGGNVSF
jgi:parallel beta-helix repeat protein